MHEYGQEFLQSKAHEHEKLILGCPNQVIFLLSRFMLVFLQMLDVLTVYDLLLLTFLFVFKCIHDDYPQLTDLLSFILLLSFEVN